MLYDCMHTTFTHAASRHATPHHATSRHAAPRTVGSGGYFCPSRTKRVGPEGGGGDGISPLATGGKQGNRRKYIWPGLSPVPQSLPAPAPPPAIHSKAPRCESVYVKRTTPYTTGRCTPRRVGPRMPTDRPPFRCSRPRDMHA
jgi:hypothetical protein